jgi:hypothetical protein
MRTTLRAGLLAASALLLPSCGHRWETVVHVSVRNDGDSAVDVHATAEYWWWSSGEDHLDLSVGPQGAAEFHFRLNDLDRLTVRITRSSDHLQIFDESWDRSDLDSLDQHVRITVHP